MKSRYVSDSMYYHNDHYLKSCILRSIVLTIQNVYIGSTFYKYLGGVVVKLLHRQKRLLSFQNEQLFVFNDKQSTQYHKIHSGVFVVKRVLNRI